MRWWQGWLDPRDVDSWAMLLGGLSLMALLVVAVVLA